MHLSRYSFTELNFLKSVVNDYLEKKESVKGLSNYAPNKSGLLDACKDRNDKQPANRQVLVKTLKQQYARQNINDDKVFKNIDALLEVDSFTVTTGHQLNLFGGTQYFIYKIAETIKAAEELSADSGKKVVPVFWMASEDHDFEEINHAQIFGERYEWTSQEKGAVGRFNPCNALNSLESLIPKMSHEKTGQELAELFSKAYKHHTLAEATRYWVHELFKNYGLVILDGDDRALKKLFAPIMRKELQKQITVHEVEKTNEKLIALDYHTQVHVRNINLFYLDEAGRNRIVKQGNQFLVLESEKTFTETEILKELDSQPEKFSPNALMRPMYQESILPNVSYIGGAAEIAYWLQLKSAFEAYDIFYPHLKVRNSAVWLNRRDAKKLRNIGYELSHLFERKEDFIAAYAESHYSGADFFDLSKEIEKLWERFNEKSDEAFHELKLEAGKFSAHKIKELKKLRQDLRKTVKAKNDADINLIHRLYDSVFPNGTLQERIDTFIPTYIDLGASYIQEIMKNLDPYAHELLFFEY